MELRHLRCFMKSAELLHFTRAATALHISQPTLSFQIRQLEDELGTRLFERRGRAVQLTEAGELFRAYARRALSEIESGQQALQDVNCLLRGVLRVGVTYSFAAELFPNMLAEFVRSYPAVRVSVEVGTSHRVEEGLESGELDLGLLCQSMNDSVLHFKELFCEEIVVVVPRGHALARLKTIQLRDLNKVRIALPPPNFRTRQLIDAAFGAAKVQPEIILEANDADILLGMARKGIAATLVTQQAAHLCTDDVAQLRLQEGLHLRAAFVWPQAGYVKPTARRFVELATMNISRQRSA